MLWLVPLTPLAGSLVVAFLPADRRWLGAAAMSLMAITLALALIAGGAGWTGRFGWGPGITLIAQLTPLSAIMLALVPGIALPVVGYAAWHEEPTGLPRLLGLLCGFAGAMELLVVAADLLILLIAWEIVGAFSWALISHQWRDPDRPRSGVYGFLMTRAGDLGLFLAAMAAYGGTGSFAFQTLPGAPELQLTIVAAGLLVAAASKSGQVPFSPWLFRAMAGPTSVSALLHAATMVAAGAYLLIRLQPTLAAVPGFGWAAIAVGTVTAIAGGVVALVQPHAKKLLAASTSAQYGLMFVAVGVGYPLVAMLHLVAHAAFKALLFLAAGVTGKQVGDYELRHMRLGRALPLIAIASAIGAAALAGLPPLGAGWTKEAIVGAAGARSPALAGLVMLAGLFSAAYASRFQLAAFGRDRSKPPGEAVSAVEQTALVILALACLGLGVLWTPGVHDAVSARTGQVLPAADLLQAVLSLGFVALGIALGAFAARIGRLGVTGRTAVLADWLGLPTLITWTVTRPALALARTAAAIDDRIVDAPSQVLARGGGRLADAIAGLDRSVVDAGVQTAGRAGAWFGELGARWGEPLANRIPRSAADLAIWGNRRATAIQTGFSHQYYAGFVAAAALTALVLMAG